MYGIFFVHSLVTMIASHYFEYRIFVVYPISIVQRALTFDNNASVIFASNDFFSIRHYIYAQQWFTL